MSTTKKKRIVALVDMDCFYVQVVQRKDPSLKGKPCAVVQYKAWKGGGIIAVGYEARKFGVTRQMRGDDAKQKCPDIVLIHVPESRGKADLTQFREAGAEVIEVLAKFTDCIERASIDEAYMDLTNEINKYTEKYKLEDIALRSFQTTHLIGLDNIELKLGKDDILQSDLFKQWCNTLRNDKDNYHLAIGAVIADDMRKAVRETTGFSCSAGVGPNKALAKLVAGFHKPNQQTLVLPENVAEMFTTTKARKIRSLGGKLGSLLEEKLKVEYMSDLCNYSLTALQTHVGEKNGELVYWLCRGVCNEPVRPRQLPQSIGCSKNFRGKEMLVTKTDIHKWLTNLVEEVWERLEKDKENNNRIASLFTVGCWNENKQNQSKRITVMKLTLHSLRDEAFRALCGMKKESGDSWRPGLTNLSFCASKFETIGSANSTGINKYLVSGSDVSGSLTKLDNSTAKMNTKSVVPIKTKENKAISNYFSMNKQKSNDYTKGTVSISAEDYNTAVDVTPTSVNSEDDGSIVKRKYREGNMLNAINLSQESASTLSSEGNCLSEDPLDLSPPLWIKSTNNNKSSRTKSSYDDVAKEKTLSIIDRDGNRQCYSKKQETQSSIQEAISGNTSDDSRVKLSSESESKDRWCSKVTNHNPQLSYRNENTDNNNNNNNINRSNEPVIHNQNTPIKKKGYFARLREEKLKTLNTNTRSTSVNGFEKLYARESNISMGCISIPSERSKSPYSNNSLSTNVRKSDDDHVIDTLMDTGKTHRTSNISITDPCSSRKTKMDPCTSRIANPGALTSNDIALNCAPEEDMMSCEMCNKRILVWDLPEHMDYHYAKGVQDSMKKEFLSLYSNDVNSASPPKKKIKQTNSMTKYFNPVRKK